MSRPISAVLREFLGSRPSQPLASVELRFGTDVTLGAVEALLATVGGLHRGAVVSFETTATDTALQHVLRGEQATLDTICGQLRGLLPTCRIEPSVSPPAAAWSYGIGLSWPRHALLRTDGAAEAATGLLASLSPLSQGEALLVRVVLRPGRPVAAPQREQARVGLVDWLFGSRQVDSRLAGAVHARNAGPLVEASVLLAVACDHPERARHLLARPTAVVRARRGAHGTVRVHRLRGRRLAGALDRPRAGGNTFSVGEVAPLIGWPIGAPRIPGLTLGASPLLTVDRRIPATGRVLGVATWPQAQNRPLAQPLKGALSHTLICGGTGSGKSVLVQQLALADMQAGRGLLLVDMKGDTVSDLLALIPPDRVEDVIVLDPAVDGPVPGLRVFGHGDDPELAADLVLGVLHDLFRDSWGVRSSQWLRAGLVTLAHDPGSTLGDLPFLFTDDAYRRRVVARVTDPLLLATWAAFEQMKPGDRSNQLGAPLNKLSELLGRRVVRNVLAQTQPGLDMRDVLARGRIVLVSLSPGRLGGPAARLVGALVAHQLFSAIEARAALPATRRTPFVAYIDEPAVFADMPVPLGGIFELARGMGVGLTLTAQSLTQLPSAVRAAALTNAATLVAFRQNADDAELLARQLSGVTAEGLASLSAFEIIARIGLGPGEISSPVSARTLPPAAATSDPDEIRRRSASRYGTDPDSVDRDLAARHQRPGTQAAGSPQAPVGRRRRTP